MSSKESEVKLEVEKDSGKIFELEVEDSKVKDSGKVTKFSAVDDLFITAKINNSFCFRCHEMKYYRDNNALEIDYIEGRNLVNYKKIRSCIATIKLDSSNIENSQVFLEDRCLLINKDGKKTKGAKFELKLSDFKTNDTKQEKTLLTSYNKHSSVSAMVVAPGASVKDCNFAGAIASGLTIKYS